MILARWTGKCPYICAFDCGDSVINQLWGVDWEGSTLITHPSVSPLVMDYWKWDIKMYLMMHYKVEWFEQTLPLAFGELIRYPTERPVNIKAFVLNAGCTVNNAIQIF